MSLQLAVSTDDFDSPLRRTIALAGTTHVDGVRLNARRDILAARISASGLRQLHQTIGENRLRVAGLSCPTRHSLAEPEYLDERIHLIRSAMNLARPLQTEPLIVPCGQIPDPDQEPAPSAPSQRGADSLANPFSFATTPPAKPRHSPRERFGLLSEIVNDLVRHGNHVGCVLTLQLPNYDIRLINALVASVTAGPIQIVFDPAIAVFTGADVVETYRDLYHYAGFVRLRDGIRNLDLAGTETALGDGTVAWEEFLPTLVEADFTGWACVERTSGDHRESDVRKGVETVKSLLPRPADS